MLEYQETGTIFDVTILRYPDIYGPRAVLGDDWSIVRRLLDGRRQLLVASDGLRLVSRSYVENRCHAVLLAIDHRIGK